MTRIACLLLAATLAPAVWADEPYLARNDLVTVTRADYEAELARLPAEQQGILRSTPERVPSFIESILLMKTLAVQARNEKLDQKPSVQAEMRIAADRVLAQRRLEQHEATLKLPDFTKRAQELYAVDPSAYEEKANYHASHIMVDFNCRTPEAAKARAEEARKVLLGGIPFADVVASYSDDPTAKRNKGDLGWRTFEELNPTLKEVLPKLKKGEVSEPVSSNFGFHVLVLHDVKPKRTTPFSEVKGAIVEKLKGDYLRTQRHNFVSAITTDSKIQVNLDAITALANAQRPPSAATPAAPPESPALAPKAPAPGKP